MLGWLRVNSKFFYKVFYAILGIMFQHQIRAIEQVLL